MICFHIDSLEEADNRAVVHIKNMIEENQRTSIIVRTTDSDVVVILVAFMAQFLEYCERLKLWVNFGTGQHQRLISVNDIYNHLEESISLALPFFHSFTGCDSTSSFYKMTKVKLFNGWMDCPMFEDITAAFLRLSWQPTDDVVNESLYHIEAFISYMYSKEIYDLDELRFQMFRISSNNCFRDLPPSKQALKLHVKRSAYQAGWIWGNSISQIDSPHPQDWGWLVNNEQLIIEWTEVHDQSTLTSLVKTCKCRPVAIATVATTATVTTASTTTVATVSTATVATASTATVATTATATAPKKCSSCSCAKKDIPCLEQCKCARTCNT